MPKKPIDYQNTIIYKIQSIDNPELLYVGSTTDFTKRKYAHKSCCNNPNKAGYNFKLYKMIRENGGWSMFNMIELYKFPCENRREAEYEEDRCIREMKSSLNTTRAFITNDEKKKQAKLNYEKNRDHKLKYRKQYYEQHKEACVEKSKRYRENHKEERAEYNKRYNQEHKEELSKKNKIYRENHKEERAECQKKYYIKHKDELSKKNIIYRENHKEERAEYQKNYQIKHKDEIKEYLLRYRQEKKEFVTCECGYVLTKTCLPLHKTRRIHQDRMKSIEQ